MLAPRNMLRAKVSPARAAVLFSGLGKSDWFPDIAAGEIPDTILHAFARQSNAWLSIDYKDEQIGRDKARQYLALLWDVWHLRRHQFVITSHISTCACMLSLLRVATFGALGPKWIFITVDAPSALRRHAHRPLRHAFLKLRLRLCWRIVCLAKFQAHDLEQAGIPFKKLVHIPFGVDTTFFENKNAGETGKYIFSAGRDNGRDYEYLLRIAPHVPHPIRIIAFEKNIPRNTVLPNNVLVEYNVPITRFREQLAHARLVVVPTKEHAESGSDCSGQTVVLQALAAERPVVASVRPWLADYLKEGSEFLALPDGNPEDAARVLNELWDNESMRDMIARAGKEVVTNMFTTDAFAQALLALILRGLAEGNKHPAENR